MKKKLSFGKDLIREVRNKEKEKKKWKKVLTQIERKMPMQ